MEPNLAATDEGGGGDGPRGGIRQWRAEGADSPVPRVRVDGEEALPTRCVVAPAKDWGRSLVRTLLAAHIVASSL